MRPRLKSVGLAIAMLLGSVIPALYPTSHTLFSVVAQIRKDHRAKETHPVRLEKLPF